MPVSRPPSQPFETSTMRRFLTRAEACILIGMVTVIFSLFLLWSQQRPDVSGLQGAAVHIESFTVPHDGFGTRVALPLTLCAVLCASTLLWEITAKNRMALSAAGGAGGLACVVIALTRFALLPGVLVGLLGGALLLFGVLDRYARVPTGGG